MFNKAMEIFDTPKEFYEEARLMLTDEEIRYIVLAGKEPHTQEEIRALILDNGISSEPEAFLQNMYKRAIVEKVVPEFKSPMRALFGNPDAAALLPFEEIKRDGVDEEINRIALYKVTDFYTRYPYFAQFELEKYAPISQEKKDAMNEWDLQVYMDMYKDVILTKMDGYEEKMHQNDWLSLDEAMEVLEKNKDFIYIIPCNCKCMDYPRYQGRLEVCVRFYAGINTEYDRGHGRRISLEEAKELVRQFNKEGLMQCGEGYSMCNCDGQCCYPVKVAQIMGAERVFPRSNWITHWDADKCIHCGKCARICNFQAFTKGEDGKVSFDESKCFGCTICSSNCPTGAITLEKIEHHFKNYEGDESGLVRGNENLLF